MKNAKSLRRSAGPLLAIRYWLLAGALGLLVLPPVFSQSGQAPLVMREQWVEVLWSGNKIGYAHLVVAPESYGGRALCRMTLDARTRLSIGGTPQEQTFRVTQWVDPDALRPTRLEVLLHSSDVSTTITANFGAERIEGHVVAVDRAEDFSVPIGDGPPIMGDLAFLVARPPAGTHPYRFLNFLTRQLREATLEVEPTSEAGAGWKVTGASSAGPVSIWLDDTNRLFRAEGPFGISLIPAGEARAKDFGSNDYVPPIELGIGTRINRTIADPYKVTRMVVRALGIDTARLPQIRGRQRVTTFAGERREDPASGIRIETWADNVADLVGAAQLPIRSKELEPYLSATDRLEVDDPDIVAKSREIVGDTTDAATAALRISRWVDEYMHYGGMIDALRSAKEILASGRGVCRDYAVLYVALARAAGIPSRLCSGLVYAVDGFYLHAWAESYVGRWVPVDPTRSGEPVDATHITFDIGGVAELWDLSFLKGQLSLEIGKIYPEQ